MKALLIASTLFATLVGTSTEASETAVVRASKGKVLLVASSTNTLQLKENKVVPTGYFLDELAVPAQHLIANGYEPVGGPPEKFGEHIHAEIAKWGPVVKRAHVRVD